MLISTSSSINYDFKRRLPRDLNFTDDYISSSSNRIHTFDGEYSSHTMKDVSTLTKTQMKVIITVVFIISLIMLIIMIFRFKNACRTQEANNLQTDIIRNRASQYSEPSSRRGSVGYYTQRYNRPTNLRFDDQLNISLPGKRLSIPACDHSSKSTAVVVLSSSSPLDPTGRTDVTHHHHVTSSCDTSNIPNQQISIAIKAVPDKSSPSIAIYQINYLSLFNIFFSSPSLSGTILSIHYQSRRLILCTVPPHIFCHPTTVRYILVVNVHDQRLRHPTTVNKNIKLSSPTLRKLCLPCITARNHSRHHSKKNKKSPKTNPYRLVTPVPPEKHRVQSFQPIELAPRTCDTLFTTPVVHSSDCSRGNNANNFPEQQQHHYHHSEISKEEKDDETLLVKIETQLVLPSSELTRSIDDDVCDDQTPLLTSELTSTIKDSANSTTRKYSLNAFFPLVRPSASHPLCTSLTSTIAAGNDVGNSNGVEFKSRRRVSLSSVLRGNSLTKQSRISCSTIHSTNPNHIPSSSVLPVDSDSSDRTSLLPTKQRRKKSSNITTSLSSYQKDFMHKIERFRFIDDSASSTTTVTSPVESIEHGNTRQACNHLITTAIEQFDDYIRSKYPHGNEDDEVNSLLECLNSDLLTNSSYSDLNILNNHSATKTILRPQTFKPVNTQTSQRKPNLSACQSIPINIPHSITSLPISRQRNHVEINGHSRSMDFQSISNRRDPISSIHETSSSSSATLTSQRSSTSLEFDDNTKPSGVLVDDDFLPMSSPVDEHFWDMTRKNSSRFNQNECFPNVGSSPIMEVKHFDLQQLNTLSETSCDEEDDDDDSTSSISTQEFQKPLLIMKSISPKQTITEEILPEKSISDPSINSTEQSNINSNSSPIRSDFLCETISSSPQHPNTIFEEDDTQESSANEASEGDDSADNGEIDLVQEFELSQKDIQPKNFWSINDRDVYIIQDDDLISDLSPTSTTITRSQPTSIMKITNTKVPENLDDQQQTFKPKVRFNLDPQYEREREWNKVNKLLGNSVEWTDEFEV